MASDPVIDIDQLCLPVSQSQPAGPYWRDDEESQELYLRVDSAFRDARTNERRKERAAYFSPDSIERQSYEDPDWRAVVDTAPKLLAKSKDLWVAAWLIEGLAYEHGFAGLRDGLKLTRRLCETYWESVHPRPDEYDGIRHTIAKIDSDMLARLILSMPITSNGLTTADYDKSSEMEGLDSESERESYRALGVIGTSDFEARVGESGAEFLQNLLDDGEAAAEEFEALTSLLDDRCGHDAPASSQVGENFQQSLDLIRELAKPYLPETEEPIEGAGPEGEQTEIGENVALRPREAAERQAGWNRGQAFDAIRRQAEMFEKFEPNSPVASLLRQAVRLGNLTWRELITGLTDDQDPARKLILQQTGCTDASEDGEQD